MALSKEKCAILRDESVDYVGQLRLFLKSAHDVFIPADQRDTNRAKWHSACESIEIESGVKLIHQSRGVWTHCNLCGTHKKPITGMKSYAFVTGQYDSDYECDYQFDDPEEGNDCYLDDEHRRVNKMRTIIIAKPGVDIEDENLFKLGVLVRGENGRRECHTRTRYC